MKYHYMFYQETKDNRVSMICLNPVTTGKDCVNRGLFSTDNDLYNQLTYQVIKKILLTNATDNVPSSQSSGMESMRVVRL